LRRALDFDPDYALAKAFLSYLFFFRNAIGWGQPSEEDSAITLAREALAANPDDPVTVRWVAHPLVQFAREYDLAQLIVHRALQMSPYSAQLLRTAGVVLMLCGEPAEAIDYCLRAMRLSPLDPEMAAMQMEYGMALVIAGKDEEGLLRLNQAVVEMPMLTPAYRFVILASWRLGRTDALQEAAAKLLAVDPHFRISTHIRPYRSQEFRSQYVQALRESGLPD